jgi:AraC-like DNA-binding protein
VGYHVAKPSPFLSQYVKQYWAIENCLPNGSEHVQRVVPNGLMEMMFYLGDKPKALDANKQITDNAILSGQQKSFYDIAVTGKLSLFSISFQPFGANQLFKIPSHEFFDQNVPLKHILKEKVAQLEGGLVEVATFEERIVVVERFLTNQLRNGSKQYELNRIRDSVSRINQSGGQIDIEALSLAACLSRKQYERVFAEYIGSTPKQFLRTVRFQNALHQRAKNKNIPLTQLAYHCGYFDQSHMINDFKLLTGISPSHYFAECEPHSDYFQ